jgi:DNA-binding NtrC family response regulator
MVAAFIHSDAPLLYILRNTPEPREPIVGTMLALREALNGNHAVDDALTRATESSREPCDADLYLIFLGLWAHLCGTTGRLAEMEVLLHRMLVLIGERTPAEIRAMQIGYEGMLASQLGNLERRDELFREIRSVLPRSSPRYKGVLLECAAMLAISGREEEIDAELEEILDGDYDVTSKRRVTAIRFLQAAETGRALEAAEHLGQLADDTEVLAYYGALIRSYRLLLAFLLDPRTIPARQIPHGSGPPPAGTEPRRTADSEHREMEPWGVVIDHLLSRRQADALRHARLEGKRDPELYLSRTGFAAFNLIRAELSSGNGEAARRLLDMRRQRHNTHYLDEFFLARVELLAGNSNAAARHFADSLVAVERFRARQRLDFELRLACEISPGELFELGRAVDKIYLTLPPTPAQPLEHSGPSPRPRGVARLLGRSPAVAAVRESILRFARLDAPVLITGETGTGKELVARALHEEGPRAKDPFIVVNCGAISETLLESELFGHERGAFTGAAGAHRGLFETAAAGTILLDEIGDISSRLQVALLRVLESGEIRPVGSSRTRRISCRIIAATNAELDVLAREGRFRKDLWFRLRRLEIIVPPLKERPEDIVMLASHFLNEFRQDGKRVSMSPALKAALLWNDWSGNVRELRNEIERMCLMNMEKPHYDLEDCGIRPPQEGARESRAAATAVSIHDSAQPAHNTELPPPPILAAVPARRRIRALRALFEAHGELSRIEIARMMGVPLSTAGRDLKLLVREGFVEKVAPSGSPRSQYFVRRKAEAQT